MKPFLAVLKHPETPENEKETIGGLIERKREAVLKEIAMDPKLKKLMERLERTKTEQAAARRDFELSGKRRFDARRKRDTRRKIITGGWFERQLLNGEDQPSKPADNWRRLYESLTDEDKKLFDEFYEREKLEPPKRLREKWNIIKWLCA